MAQKLKEELRTAILEAAREEFLEKGYRNASMRSIAEKAGMTVGNLYRYFPSKEDINHSIVAPTLEKIDRILKELTADNVSMETHVFTLKADISELIQLMKQLSGRLTEVYEENKIEFNILMMNSQLNKGITEWFAKAINTLIDQHYLMEGFSNEKQILSRTYAVSIFSGMKEIFRFSDLNAEDRERIISTYLCSYIYLLDSDFRKMVR